MNPSTSTTHPEIALANRSAPAPRFDDSLDYRVMLAREVMAEDCWRVNSEKLTPADLAEIDTIAVETGTTTSVREQVEDYCGEALA